MFVEIEPELLEKFATVSDRMPKLYYHPNRLARSFFWERLKCIHRYLTERVPNRDTCLDFGCGTGVFLPTLSGHFNRVTAIDMETEEATQIIGQFRLTNVELVRGDICSPASLTGPFQVITAADVLEHFASLAEPVERIRQWLADDGVLMTSLPTEGFLTRATRVVGAYTKPFDHYHTAREVETYLQNHGLKKVYTTRVSPWFPLYRISAWQKC